MAIRYERPTETAIDKIITAVDNFATMKMALNSEEAANQESARRFDEQMAADANARNRQQLNYQQEQIRENKKFAFDVKIAEKSEDAGIDQGVVSSLDKILNLNQKIARATKLLPGMKTEIGKTNLQGIIDSSQETINSRKLNLDSLLEIELIQPNEYNIMNNNIASAGYDNMNTQIVGQAIKQSNLVNNRGWLTDHEELKSINTLLTVETKNMGTAAYSTEKARKEIQTNIKDLNARKVEVLKSMRVGSKTKATDTTPGTVTLAGGSTISGADYDSYVQGTSDDLAVSVWSAMGEDDINDLEQRRKEYASGVQAKLAEHMEANPVLTKKEKAILRKAEADEKKKAIAMGQGIDMTGRSTLQGFLDMMQNLQAGENPQTPTNPFGR